MNMSAHNPDDEDFDPNKAIRNLSANLEQPDKFAEIFCKAAKKQKDIDNILKDTIKNLLQHDNETRKMIKDMLREIEKEDWKKFLKKIGMAGWSLIVAGTSAIITIFATSFIGRQ